MALLQAELPDPPQPILLRAGRHNTAHKLKAVLPGTDDNKSLHQKGRSKIPWSKDVWDRIDQAVEMEVKRTRVGARFLPKRSVPPKTTSVPTDAYSFGPPAGGGNPLLTVDEGSTTRLNEYYVEFELTPQQVDQEEGDFKQLGHSTAVTLATKAANTLAQAEDLIIFQGQNAITAATLFTKNLCPDAQWEYPRRHRAAQFSSRQDCSRCWTADANTCS